MNITQQELQQLKKIEKLFGEIDDIYSGFSAELQEKLSELHNYEGSLGYCTRWGVQAIEEIVKDCEKDTKSLLDEFRDLCFKKGDEYSKKYSEQHKNKFMIYDGTWDSNKDDCNKYCWCADYLVDQEAELFDDCETIENCMEVLENEFEARNNVSDSIFDGLGDEQSNLSYGTAKLDNAVIIEVGSIGRWNGTSHGLNILDIENIGELLTSDCPQWMCYVDKATGELCKAEHHHDGSNFYTYRELTCDKDTFEDLLEQCSPGEMDNLVEKYSKPAGWRAADVYGWDLGKKPSLEEQMKSAESLKIKPENEKNTNNKEIDR